MTRPVWEGLPIICDECEDAEIAAKRKDHFDQLDKLTIEERIRRIEKWIYDYETPLHSPFDDLIG